ncbi:hypothetical protein [Chondromyces apiculatus]|uniref:Transposase (putative) YhgA-like domain-containing protein n=1 Tax=Chondromyces apiculatus DSM 436 TaxID=1192034 RepID=A0A017T5B6_9BACT|nr:hypothetical protein [Chondromyces apiculatus]EYF04187.1 Hypothetical protein CAP_4664 [Chondromyces apiculatus DSM 436]
MPSLDHEALVDLFRNRPTLAAELLRAVLRRPLPRYREARITSADLSEVLPADRRADLLILLTNAQQKPVLAIVLEIQLHPDRAKRYVWPVYVTHTRARHQCPTRLVVVTINPRMVRWCSRPIPTGHAGFTLEPLVLGPSCVPVVTDPAQARASPELAVLSAMTHGKSAAGLAIAGAFLEGAAALEDTPYGDYLDLVLSSLNEAARRRLQAMLTAKREYRSEYFRNLVAEGVAEGQWKAKSEAVLSVLDTRGLDVSAEVRERILASKDLAELEQWLRRAVVVSSAEELFAPPAS